MTTPITKIIGLDFDNVINDNAHLAETAKAYPGVRTFSMELGRAMLDPVRCARVQRICDATGAGILFVTGWRRWTGEEGLTELIRGHGITAPVVGVVGGVKFSGDLRASATREWLNEHPEVTRYVILDDDEYNYWRDYPGRKTPPWGPVLVAPKDGLEDEHVERAISILNRE